jgi:2-polyprenyl-3-methyl-5-hydroxy-6-metoxy-1,4-benzoquinol methylase
LTEIDCNLCGCQASAVVYRKWEYTIVRCEECGLVFVNPRTVSVESDEYFKDAYLDGMEAEGKMRPEVRVIYDEILDILDRMGTSGRLLDVGCAMGHFAHHASERGWMVRGVEASPYAVEHARRQFGIDAIVTSDIRTAGFAPDSFDAVVLVEVIEHLPDPLGTLAEIHRLLRPGGIVILTTPNFSSFASMVLREEWMAVIPTGHLYYFDGASLGATLHAAGFKTVKNLTGAAEFEQELARCRNLGSVRLSPAEVQTLRSETGRSSVGRSERLLMYATKQSVTPLGETGLNTQSELDRREGFLIQKIGGAEAERKVYLVQAGCKRWVISARWIVDNGFDWPGDVHQVHPDLIARLPEGPPIGD